MKAGRKERLAALVASGEVVVGATGTCFECESYPDVLDGLRKASAAKYTFGRSAYCGSHILRIAEDRDTVWNGSAYVARR